MRQEIDVKNRENFPLLLAIIYHQTSSVVEWKNLLSTHHVSSMLCTSNTRQMTLSSFRVILNSENSQFSPSLREFSTLVNSSSIKCDFISKHFLAESGKKKSRFPAIFMWIQWLRWDDVDLSMCAMCRVLYLAWWWCRWCWNFQERCLFEIGGSIAIFQVIGKMPCSTRKRRRKGEESS